MDFKQERPFTQEDVDAMNQAARNHVLKASESSDASFIFGYSQRTVQRWFTNSDQQRPLVPPSIVGKTRRDLYGPNSDGLRKRVIAGMLLLGDITKVSSFSSQEVHTQEKDYASLSRAVKRAFSLLARLPEDRYYSAAFERINVVKDEDGLFHMKVDYRKMMPSDGSDPLRSVQDDDLDPEDEEEYIGGQEILQPHV